MNVLQITEVKTHKKMDNKTTITDQSLKDAGFIKKVNAYLGHGINLFLSQENTWVCSKMGYKRKDVLHLQQVIDYVINPEPLL
jgi:hypothetical protein